MSAPASASTHPEDLVTSIAALKQFFADRGIDCSGLSKKAEYVAAVKSVRDMENRVLRECEQPTIVDTSDLSRPEAARRFEAHLRALLPKSIEINIESCTMRGKVRYQLKLTGDAWVANASLLNTMIQAFLVAHHPHFHTVSNSITYHSRKVPSDISKGEFELTEFQDDERVVRAKVGVLARIMKLHQNTVVYTGAGISTSAKIADFRGPNGVWTARDFGRKAAKSVSFEVAQPTLTHWMIKHGLDTGLFRYCTSQNVDGLHRRSGVPVSHLSELHGNCFREICATCKADHIRPFDVDEHPGPYFKDVDDVTRISHITGRKCETCKEGMLRDSIIHFGESLPERDLQEGMKQAKQSYASLVMGSSLRVTPAADIPEQCRGPMIIANLQATGRDDECLTSGGFIIHAKTDTVSALLCQALDLPITSFVPSTYESPDELKPLLRTIIEQQQAHVQSEQQHVKETPEEKKLPDQMKHATITTTTSTTSKSTTRTTITTSSTSKTKPTATTNEEECNIQ